MILAAGLSPAWQQIIVFEQLTTGAVNRAREVHWCASGKALNVALALKHLSNEANGVSARSVAIKGLTTVGGDTGASIRREVNQLQVPLRWIETETPTRVCTTILDRSSGETTELVENALPISPEELACFQIAFLEESRRASVVVLTGSFPDGVPPTFYRELMKSLDCPVIIDAQRVPLLAALEARPLVVKPNREELGNTLGLPIATIPELHSAMNEMCRRGAAWVVTSEGKERVWIGSKHGIRSVVPPVVEVVNPIGCGDCLAAGIALGLARGDDVPQAVQLGIAAAAENATQLLPARLDPQRVAARRETLHF